MRSKWKHLRTLLSGICLLGLFAFTNHRNSQREIREMKVEFIGDENLYMTEDAVNKLLIQKYGALSDVPQDKVVLSNAEELLEAHAMVRDAEVYLALDGVLTAKIEQRKPIGRVEGLKKYYLDEDGKPMPLSKNHSARVPIITGDLTGKALEDIYQILKYINKDDFLRKNVIGIHVESEEQYQLKFRMDRFVVYLGGVEDMDKKFRNFKAFYAKALKDKTLDEYLSVSLEFDNQVVCTKI